jgi:hypothetical protein
MKIIERLSERWALEHGLGSTNPENRSLSILCAEEVAYEAGFRAGRQMVSDLCNDECGAQCELRKSKIDQLGENEE